MSMYLAVPLGASLFFWVALFSIHHCGILFGMLEIPLRGLNLHDTHWEAMSPTVKQCLAEGSSLAYRPKHFASYYQAWRALWFGPRSRYETTWQDSQSYQFEREAAQYLGVKHMFYVSTGTSALEVMMLASGIGPGDEVILPPAAWIACASAITVHGAIPVFAEVDKTLSINPRTLESYITPRTRAVLAVHLRGAPCNITGIKEVTDRRGLLLLEDVAQSFGSSVRGKMAGTHGDLGMTSVNPTKPYHAGGQGGLVWTDDDDVAERLHWAIENKVALVGGPENLPMYKESFGPAGAAGTRRTPFAGHGYRAPSEWHAAYARQELVELPRVTKQMQDLRLAFIAAMKPEHRKYLQWQEDPAGDKAYAIIFILGNASHKEPLQKHLQQYGIHISTNPYKVFNLPKVPTIVDKVSYHSSGFPWDTEERRAPDAPGAHAASLAILERITEMTLSFHNSPTMMRWAAARVSEGLDTLA